MLKQKQKNIISYQLYTSKKSQQPDYLYNVIGKYQQLAQIQLYGNDPKHEEVIKRGIMQKRIREIKKIHKCKKVSPPEPYVKRTWVSPVEIQQKKKEIIFSKYRKNPNVDPIVLSDKDKTTKIYSILDINKKMHRFGQYLYSQFESSENSSKIGSRLKNKNIDIMQKQYNKLMGVVKTVMVVCNRGSEWNRKVFINPLQSDKYYKKTIRKNDEQLTRLLVESLLVGNNFTLASYIQFYDIFVWQQAKKITQVEFVIKVLMGNSKTISYRKLSQVIDIMCSKINLLEHNESLDGFNEIMKKLIFGVSYSECLDPLGQMTREELAQSLEMNEECISIFINVFYCQ